MNVKCHHGNPLKTCIPCRSHVPASKEHIAAMRQRMREQAGQHTPHQPQED